MSNVNVNWKIGLECFGECYFKHKKNSLGRATGKHQSCQHMNGMYGNKFSFSYKAEKGVPIWMGYTRKKK